MKIYLFNPDNDLALANHQAHYMPPAPIKQLISDLAMLPFWYADAGSGVLASSAYNEDFLKRMNVRFQRDISLITPPEVAAISHAEYIPWGWNIALRRGLMQLGVDEALLPSVAQLDKLRDLSSRHTCEDILHSFAGVKPFIGEAWCLKTTEECRRKVEQLPACVLKLPWSSSGKGLNWCRHGFTSLIEAWCARSLRQQGSIQASPIYDKVFDFAMEFHIHVPNEVQFIGYSRFTTNESGAYQGNLLLSDADIEQEISSYLLSDAWREVHRLLMPHLCMLSNHYQGFIGIDMMVCRQGEAYYLHPCVELNLRMNMGIVAHHFYHAFVAPTSRGMFQVAHYNTPEQLNVEVERLSHEYPLRMEDARIVSGFMPLVPVTPRTHNLAYVIIEG